MVECVLSMHKAPGSTPGTSSWNILHLVQRFFGPWLSSYSLVFLHVETSSSLIIHADLLKLICPPLKAIHSSH